MRTRLPKIGIGLRAEHLKDFPKQRAKVDLVELLADQWFSADGAALDALSEIIGPCPVTLHSVGLSLGSTGPIDRAYTKDLKRLIKHFKPAMVSDHLCWTAAHGVHFHELLPLPFTDEAVRHVSRRIQRVQDNLEVALLIENVTSYLNFKGNTLSEGQFLKAVAHEANCRVLLDISNMYINSFNHETSLLAFEKEAPWDRVAEFHLGGFETRPGFLFDAHSQPIAAPVWKLWRFLRKKCPDVPTIIEWDNEIPSLSDLLVEVATARRNHPGRRQKRK